MAEDSAAPVDAEGGQAGRPGDELRKDILARIAAQLAHTPEAALSEALAACCDPTAGGGEGPDLFSMLSEMAALRQEVRLLSRTQNRLTRALERAEARLQSASEIQARATAAGEAAGRDAAGWRARAYLTPFLDLRDATERAITHAAGQPEVPWWRRWRAAGDRGRASLEALQQALDRIFAQAGVVPFASVGDAFDPRTMVAVGCTDDPQVADGCLAQVARCGFTFGQELIRSAEVVVGRHLPSPTHHGG